MKKKLLSMILTATMVVGLCACGSTADNTTAADDKQVAQTDENVENTQDTAAEKEQITLKVWGSQTDQELLVELCEAFAAENPDKEWTFDYGVVGEADAQARYLEDPAAAADVFSAVLIER